MGQLTTAEAYSIWVKATELANASVAQLQAGDDLDQQNKAMQLQEEAKKGLRAAIGQHVDR